MDSPEFEAESLKKLVVPLYKHHEAGLQLELKHMAVYLTNAADFELRPEEFEQNRHEHSIPKYEMARIYLLVCAMTADDLGFTAEDRDDPIYQMYEKAYQRCMQIGIPTSLRPGLSQIASQCGFESLAPAPG